MHRPTKLKRIAPGYYTATTLTTLTHGGKSSQVAVETEISLINGYGREWTITVHTVDGIKLCDNDCTMNSFADAKIELDAMLSRGWTYYKMPGFSTWALTQG